MNDDTIQTFETETENLLLQKSVKIDKARVVAQYLRPTEDETTLALLSVEAFEALVGQPQQQQQQPNRRRLQNYRTVLLVKVEVEGKMGDSATLSFGDAVRESIQDNVDEYEENLSQGSPFFAYLSSEEKNGASMIAGSSSPLNEPLIIAAVIIGGLTGSLVMLAAAFLLFRRNKPGGRQDSSSWRNSRIMQSFTHRNNNNNKARKDHPLHPHDEPPPTHIIPTDLAPETEEPNNPMEGTPYPQSIHISSQDSFSALTSPEFRDGPLMMSHRAPVVGDNNLVHRRSEMNEPSSWGGAKLEKIEGSEEGSSSQSSTRLSISEYLKAGKQLLEINASAGPLGLVVKSSKNGPIICEISPDSPLHGALQEEDLMVSVNDVDVRKMSAIEFAGYIVSKEQEPQRLIAVLRSMKALEMII